MIPSFVAAPLSLAEHDPFPSSPICPLMLLGLFDLSYDHHLHKQKLVSASHEFSDSSLTDCNTH